MTQNKFRYIAKLRGTKPFEFHFRNLKSNNAYVCYEKLAATISSYEISGPIKTDNSFSLENLKAQLTNRAAELGIQEPNLAKNASRQIFNAQEGEKFALSDKMQVEILPSENGSLIFVSFLVQLSDDSEINDCIEQYSQLRVIWLAEAMGMSIEGSIEKSVC